MIMVLWRFPFSCRRENLAGAGKEWQSRSGAAFTHAAHCTAQQGSNFDNYQKYSRVTTSARNCHRSNNRTPISLVEPGVRARR
jgi:hypothetical protein